MDVYATERVGAGRLDGAPDAFVAAHFPRLVRIAVLIGLSAEEAESVVCEALERGKRRRRNASDHAEARLWLDRRVVAGAVRAATRRRRDARAVSWTGAPLPGFGDGWTSLRTAFARLTPSDRAALLVPLYLGYGLRESASVLDVSADAAASRITAARSRLRRLLGEDL